MKKIAALAFVLGLSILGTTQIAHASTYVWTNVTPAGSHGWGGITSSSDGTHLATIDGPGYVYTSTSTGVTFIAQVGSGSRQWQAITSSADGTHLAALDGYLGNIYMSTTSGITWTKASGVNATTLYDITSSADGTHLAATDQSLGYIYLSTTTGMTWATSTSLSGHSWKGITSSADGTHLAVVASGGDIYTSTTSGATWTDQTASGARSWVHITSSADGTHLAATVNGGYIYTSTDSGATWTAQTSAGSRSWGNITSSADGTHLAAVVSGGDVYISTDSGATWIDQVSLGTNYWQGITSSSDGTHLAVVSYGGGNIYTGFTSTSSPLVSLTAPTGGATIGGAFVTVTASSTAIAGSIAGVGFNVDGSQVISPITSSTTQFSATLDATVLSNGTHSITAISEDVFGNYATSTPVSVTVQNPPLITSISAGIPAQTDATITWNTSLDPSTSQVEYGLTSAYTASSTLNPATTTSHSVSLSGLSAGTTYHYAVISSDSSGTTATSSDQTFTTASAYTGGGGGGGSSGSSGGGGSSSSATTHTKAVTLCIPKTPGSSILKCTTTITTLPNNATATSATSGFGSVINGAGTVSYIFTKALSQGSRNKDVLNLQKYLNAHGFSIATTGSGSLGNETNYFGKATKMALIKFQIANGISPTGTLGPKTRAYINSHE